MANLSHIENNQPSLQALIRAIKLSQGQFQLRLLRCNYRELRDRIIQQLQDQSPIEIQELVLPKTVRSLYATIQANVRNGQTKALMVSGLESAPDLDAVLTSSNNIREEFRNFRFPLLVWVNNDLLRKFYRLVPDFTNWATITDFNLTPDEVVKLLQRKDKKLFESNRLLPVNPEDRSELEAARQDLIKSGGLLPYLEASLEFGLGLCALENNQINDALAHYNKSLSFWQQKHNFKQQGILRLNIARCYERQAEQKRAEKKLYLEKASDELQQCLELFNQAQRQDLVADHIGKLGEVWRRLQDWNKLKALAEEALKLHQDSRYSRQLAQDYGFLAEMALKKQSCCKEAKEFAEKALLINDIKPQKRALYQFLLANSQADLGEVSKAVSNLEDARKKSEPQSDPQLYIDILEKLRLLRFEQGEYREAFRIKQEKITIEHQYGFRAFIGASALPCPVENKG